MFSSEWFWLFLALLIFWALGAHNRLVRLRAQVSQRFFALEALLLKYPDVVSQAVTAAAIAPLGWRSTVGFDLGAEHWGRLQEAAKEAIIALARMNEHPLNAQSSAEVNLAVSTLAYAWHVLVHPDVSFYRFLRSFEKGGMKSESLLNLSSKSSTRPWMNTTRPLLFFRPVYWPVSRTSHRPESWVLR